MKRIFLCILFLQTLIVNAQKPSEIIFIGTSVMIPENHIGIFDGFGKFISPKRPYTKSSSIAYSFGTKGKNFELELNHVNFKDQTKPDLAILDVHINQMQNFGQIVDIDEFIASKSRNGIYRWALENLNKNIWIIDRRDFYKSDPKLKEPDMMKIVQCEIWIEDIPDDILNPTS